MRLVAIEIPDGVDWDTLPNDHWEKDDDGDRDEYHRGDKEEVVFGLGEDAYV